MTSIQITTIGDGFVGKTCLLQRFIADKKPNGYEPTVFESHCKEIEVDGKKYNLQLWDTAGQEDYDRLRALVYPWTDCFLVCFSIDSENSFKNIADKWVPEIRHFKPRSPIILVGTKVDLRQNHICHYLAPNEGNRLKDNIKADSYVESSSVNGQGINVVFEEAVRAYVKKKNLKKNRRTCTVF